MATVTLRDVNDTPPRFSPSVYSVSFPENERGNPSVLKLSVNDPDTTGTIRAISSLDRETQDLYRLTVSASDSVHTSTASVTISVTDNNDHSPAFNQSFYSFQVHEDADIGATVARGILCVISENINMCV
nr:hypothetical protein BaRGS_005081 [Batillaria attramentaria]